MATSSIKNLMNATASGIMFSENGSENKCLGCREVLRTFYSSSLKVFLGGLNNALRTEIIGYLAVYE